MDTTGIARHIAGGLALGAAAAAVALVPGLAGASPGRIPPDPSTRTGPSFVTDTRDSADAAKKASTRVVVRHVKRLPWSD